jgi:hypothetical protein
MNTTAQIAKRTAINTARHTVVIGVLLALVWIVGLNTFTHDPNPTHNLGTLATPHTPALVTRHHCWTGEGPEGVIPGHVVAQTDGGHIVYGGPALVAKALSGDRHVWPLGFCR